MSRDTDPLLDRPAWAPTWLPTVDDLDRIRWLRWAIGLVLGLGLVAFVARGADQPADPVLGPPTTLSSLAQAFGTVAARIVATSGEILDVCLLHAEEPGERAQGLTMVIDLQGHDGMLFVNDPPGEGAFVMAGTPLPLSVSWWGEDRVFRSSADMAPCAEADPNACQRYPSNGPYRWAIQAPIGSPAATAAVAGSVLSVGEAGCVPS